MAALEISPGRIRERLATRRSLNAANRTQTQEVKKKLVQLREFFEAEIERTRDAATAERMRLVLAQVVAKLEKLEAEDERTQSTEAGILDYEAAQARREQKDWRPGR